MQKSAVHAGSRLENQKGEGPRATKRKKKGGRESKIRKTQRAVW